LNPPPVDFLAAGLTAAIGLVLAFTTVGGATFNLIFTLAGLAVIVLILILGFIKGKTANLSPFLPYGVRGIMDGASFVFFS
jgi:APA family basic amino acid/polyamine antiporter